MERLPNHFRKDRSSWGNLADFILARPRQMVVDHYSNFSKCLSIIIEHGPAEDQEAAKSLQKSITMEAFVTASNSVQATREAARCKASTSKFITKTYQDVGTALGVVRDKMLGDLMEQFKVLNQELCWKVGDVDMSDKLKDLKLSKADYPYSLSKDSIADVTVNGEMTEVLTESEFDAIMDGTLIITFDSELSLVLGDALFPTSKAGFAVAMDAMNEMRKDQPAIKFASIVLDAYVIPLLNERQFFMDIVIPSFRHAFRQFSLNMELMEVPIYGCRKRKNIDRAPITEKVCTPHFADGVVMWRTCQPVLMECAPPEDPDQDKRHRDHYKLTRDMKDTWAHCVEQLVISGRQPPKGLTVFGVQIYDETVEIYAMDFVGCFRLQQLRSFTLPIRAEEFQENFRQQIQICYGFAHLVKEELTRWEEAPLLHEAMKRKAARMLGQLPPTNITPTKCSKQKKTRLTEKTDEDVLE
ncbi:hypothetical protein BGX26_004101 [Mortierella sp. AD094]|nr:hypothetical protein BGX26_004101 [Mortierella sp. AD094]